MENKRGQEAPEHLSFNMALDYTKTIAENLNEHESLWRKGLLSQCLWSLKTVWHILSPYLNDVEDNYIEKEFNSIQILIIKKGLKGKANQKIEKLNRHLRRKLKERGLLIPISDDPRFMFKKK